MKRRVAVVFGGRSAEHEISVISARSVIDALDPDRQHAGARSTHGLTGDQEPTEPQLKQAAQALAKKAQ